jgi:hypothetical protein
MKKVLKTANIKKYQIEIVQNDNFAIYGEVSELQREGEFVYISPAEWPWNIAERVEKMVNRVIKELYK